MTGGLSLAYGNEELSQPVDQPASAEGEAETDPQCSQVVLCADPAGQRGATFPACGDERLG